MRYMERLATMAIGRSNLNDKPIKIPCSVIGWVKTRGSYINVGGGKSSHMSLTTQIPRCPPETTLWRWWWWRPAPRSVDQKEKGQTSRRRQYLSPGCTSFNRQGVCYDTINRGLLRLTPWGRDKMDAISQTTFSNEFPWMKMYEYHWNFTEVCSSWSN